MGLEDYLSRKGVCVVEWAEKEHNQDGTHKEITIKDSSGTARNGMKINASDVLEIGDSNLDGLRVSHNEFSCPEETRYIVLPASAFGPNDANVEATYAPHQSDFNSRHAWKFPDNKGAVPVGTTFMLPLDAKDGTSLTVTIYWMSTATGDCFWFNQPYLTGHTE